MKYDALHNRQFLETMFYPGEDGGEIGGGGGGGSRTTQIISEVSTNVTKETSSTNELPKLRELYHLSKVLFEYVFNVVPRLMTVL